jgi:hypothetical protein
VEFRSKNGEFTLLAPDVIYKEMSQKEIEMEENTEHQDLAEFIFPEEETDPDYPKQLFIQQ